MSNKTSTGKILSIIGMILLVSVIVLGILFGTRLIFSSPADCGDGSYDYECVCSIGQAKTGFFPWKCENLPQAPEVSFPIETWEEARGYVEELLGVFSCTGNYQYDNLLTGEIQQQCGRYGNTMTDDNNNYLGNLVAMECRSLDTIDENGQPIAGQMVFDVRFDPNDGHVYKLHCEDSLVQCPEVTFGNNPKPEPQTICGDGCCHNGENNDNCPSECEVEVMPICTAEDVSTWVSLNGGVLAYGKLCDLVLGTIKTTGMSLYPECNYKQQICELNGKEVLRWHLNSHGDCGKHSLLGYNDEVICPAI